MTSSHPSLAAENLSIGTVGSEGCSRTLLRKFEATLFFITLLGRSLLLLRLKNYIEGFDPIEHVKMIMLYQWNGKAPGVFDTLYSYHPPLGFLLARIFFLLGFEPSFSAELVSFLSFVGAFALLRSFLKWRGMLDRWEGIVFLYGTLFLPLQIFLSVSISLESVLFFEFVVILVASMRLLWFARRGTFDALLWLLVLIAGLSAACLTKFSGLVYLSIPVLVWCYAPREKKMQSLIFAALAVCVSVSIVFPYYYARNYLATGTFLPDNTAVFASKMQVEARSYESEHPLDFWLTFFFTFDTSHFRQLNDLEMNPPRLSQTWLDVWMRRSWLGEGNPFTNWIGLIYAVMMPAILALGYVGHRASPSSWWKNLGSILLVFSVIEVASLIFYVSKDPAGNGVPTKAIYIIPVTLALGYLLARTPEGVHSWRKWDVMHWEKIFLMMLIVLTALNLAIPVY